MGMGSEGSFQKIKAQVPQSEMYHYSTTLRSLTGGRGIHSEEISHYSEVPRDMESKVITEAKTVYEEDK
jgi:elongation factor G